MKSEKFDYNLPSDKIAHYPVDQRGESKLLVIERDKEIVSHHKYSDIVDFVDKGDIVVLNNTKVTKVRFYFLNEKKKLHETLFFPQPSLSVCRCLIKDSRGLSSGDILKLEADQSIEIKLLKKNPTEPIWDVILLGGELDEIASKYGHVPLPPYIRRKDEPSDYRRYNTVFAKEIGSSASPTASLNLTEEILKSLRSKGVVITEITLDVGWATFAPIWSDEIEDHIIHTESFSISKDTSDSINRVKADGGKVWSFGTTVTRVLETVAKEDSLAKYSLREAEGETDLYIYPGYQWKVVDHLITNFHAPRTSLLTLVGSFMGYNLMKKAYQEALENEYRFLSYGDTMLII